MKDDIGGSTAVSVARELQRVDGIDLLRGLSILFVLANHIHLQLLFAGVAYTKRWPEQLAYTIGWNGQFGVQIFFVVSGFLITSTSIRRWRTPGELSPREFYLLRLARIAPLLLALLLALSALHLAHVPGFIVHRETGGLGSALFAALTFHINLLEATRGYLPGSWDILWSLSVEEMFYLFFPVVARSLPAKKLLFLLLSVFIIVGPFARAKAFNHNPVWREYSYLGGMDAIALGCLTAIAISGRRLTSFAKKLCGCSGAALLAFSLGCSVTAYSWGLGRNGLNMTILAVGAAFTIVFAVQSEWQAPRILKPLRVLGECSYETYLTHMFIVIGVFSIFVHAGKPLGGVPVIFLAVFTIACLVGWFIAVHFTEPLNRYFRQRFKVSRSILGTAVPEAEF